jgi:hypothetical protein
MKKMILLISLMVLGGCATKLFAPDLEFTKTENNRVVSGTVVYNPLGLEQLVDQRRNQAFKRMRQACGKGFNFKITKEETASPASRDERYDGQMQNLSGHQVRFIDYECEKI